MTGRDDALRIDKEHPWPWLDAFPESAREFFNGRDDAARQLLRCVLATPATVLFGKSGLGKTSLLQAGLSPLLREEQLLPVLVRLTHQEDRAYQPGQLSGRLLARLGEETRACGLRCDRLPLPDDTTTANATDGTTPAEANAATRLWELLHDTEARWLDAQDEEWAPVFILDQFEEVFTLLHDTEQQQRLFSELGNLIQNRTPTDVAERRKSQDALRRRLDPERQGARFVLSLREDYLPDLEIHADRIPRLGPNRYRLLPMSHANALEAIDKTGGALVDTADTKRIVKFLDQQNQSTDPSRPRLQRRESIEPALLSLVCAGLNLHRIEHHAKKLDTSSLEKLGGQLLEQFYDQAFAALPEKRRETAAHFVETELITLDGTRRPFPEKSLPKVGLTADDMATLKDKRLLRTDNTEHGAYVELVHDRLAVIATQRAALSRQRAEQVRIDAEAAEVARRKQLQRRIYAWTTTIIMVVIFLGLGGIYLQWQKALHANQLAANLNKELETNIQEQRTTLGRAIAAEKKASEAALEALAKAIEARAEAERALRAENKAKRNLQQADIAKHQAQASARDATAQRVLSDANDLFGGANRPSTGIQSFLMTLVGHRIAQQSSLQHIQNAGYAALQREDNRSESLTWLHEADSAIFCIAFSPDGSRIVSGSGDQTLRLWDAHSGQPIGEPLKGHSGSVSSVAFSSDGTRIVSGSWDKTLRLWDARSGRPIGGALKGHSDTVSSVAFSRDGTRIVSGSWDNNLWLWDAQSGQRIGEPIKGHTDIVSSVAFSPDGTRIVSGSGKSDKTLRLWDAHSGLPIGGPLTGHSDSISSVAFSHDGTRIVSGSWDNTLRLWDVQSREPIGEPFKGHSRTVSSVAFTPDDSHIVSSSMDRTLRLWDAHSGQPIGEPLKGHSDSIWCIALSLNGLHIASGSDDKTLRLWSTRSWSSISEPPKGHLDSLTFSPDGSRIVSGIRSRDNTLHLWEASSGRSIGELKGHLKTVLSVAFSTDSSRIVSGSSDNTLRLWDAQSGQRIGEPLKGHTDMVLSVAFSRDGSRIVSGSADKNLQLWDARSGRPIGKPLKGHSGPVLSVAFSRDGSRIVSGSADKNLQLWDARSGRPIGEPLKGHSGPVLSVAFSRDGSRIVSGSGGSDNTLRVWDTHSGRSIGEPLKGHSSNVFSIAFSPDSSRIVSSSVDYELRLWDARSVQPIGGALKGHSGIVSNVAFSPDGTRIISGSDGHTLRLWPVLESWASDLCAKLPRNMSRKEWREWISPDIPYLKEYIQCPNKPIPAD